MSTMTKVFIVLTTVTAIALSCLTIAVAARFQNADAQMKKDQELAQATIVRAMQVEGVAAANSAIQADTIAEQGATIARHQETISQLSKENADLRARAARLENDLASAESGRTKLEELLGVHTSELNATQKQNQELVSENIKLQTRIQQLAARVLELTGQNTIANDQIRNLQEKLYSLEQEFKNLQDRVASGVRPNAPAGDVPADVMPQTPLATGPINGEIAQVDGNYVTLSVGQSSGVVSGMTFVVHRGGSYVGDVQIDTVRPKECGGKVTMTAHGQTIQVGDRVSYGLENN